jgi:hypothetical protein
MPDSHTQDDDFLAQQLRRMAANWRQPLTNEEQREIRKLYAEVLEEVGKNRFAQAVNEAIKFHLKFWPSVAEFIQYLPPAEIREREGCGTCTEGWRFTEVTLPDGKGRPAVKRCSCHPGYRGFLERRTATKFRNSVVAGELVTRIQ